MGDTDGTSKAVAVPTELKELLRQTKYQQSVQNERLQALRPSGRKSLKKQDSTMDLMRKVAESARNSIYGVKRQQVHADERTGGGSSSFKAKTRSFGSVKTRSLGSSNTQSREPPTESFKPLPPIKRPPE